MNFADATWNEIEQWAQAQLKKHRDKNDDASLDAVQTAELRGRIGMLKDLLALPRRKEVQALHGRPE